MIKNNTDQNVFKIMLENFNLTKNNLSEKHKSSHWDVFPTDYETVIKSQNAWKKFLRNSISLGFNDDLLKFDNSRWENIKEVNNVNAWKMKHDHNYDDLVPEIIKDINEREEITKVLRKLLSFLDINFLYNYQQSQIGSPPYVPIELKDIKSEKKINLKCNLAELGNIYYFFQISRVFEISKNLIPVIAEIGSGYGGLIAKIKKKFIKSKCIIFDLPELSCVQTYYLNNEFPDLKFLYYRDFEEKGADVFYENFDFLILPCNTFNRLPKNYLDLIINARSMMEMELKTINYYFETINQAIKKNGLFACFNRYIKNSSGENIILKNYPFGLHWSIEISQSSAIQSHIHDLILKKNFDETSKIADKLKTLPPY